MGGVVEGVAPGPALIGSNVLMGVTAVGLGLGVEVGTGIGVGVGAADGIGSGTGVGVGAADGIGSGTGVGVGFVFEAIEPPDEKTTLKAAPEGTGVPLRLATNHFDAAALYSTLYSSLSKNALRDGGFTGNTRTWAFGFELRPELLMYETSLVWILCGTTKRNRSDAGSA